LTYRQLLSGTVAPRPRPTRGAPPPFQPDDLIDFHQLLAADDWFDQLMAVEHRARVGD
jgi:hypothetical protein